jgi:hypothetical protein
LEKKEKKRKERLWERESRQWLYLSIWVGDRFTYEEAQSLEIFSLYSSVYNISFGFFAHSNQNNVMTHSTNSLYIFLFILLNIFLLFPCLSTNEVELRRYLFEKRPYDRKVCPEEGITKVYTNLILLQIESVDEKAQV